jgi:hypothetical protein
MMRVVPLDYPLREAFFIYIWEAFEIKNGYLKKCYEIIKCFKYILEYNRYIFSIFSK